MSRSFIVAVNAVVPFFFYLALGAGARAAKAVDEAFLQKLTKMVFAVMFPFMTFNNVYSATWDGLPSLTLTMFIGGGILLTTALLVFIVPKLVKENARRGVMIQGLFRGNYVLLGVPLTVSVFGPEKGALAAMMVVVVLTFNNILAVIVLEMFNGGSDGKKSSAGSLLLNVAKNPMIIGCVVGLVFFIFRIRLPDCLASPIAAISSMTTPLAMFALGGTLRFNAIAKNMRYISSVLLIRLIVMPLVMMCLGYAIGLRSAELFLVLTVFGTPSAAASYPMAMNMGGDGELAGQLVFTSTAVSMASLFVWIFCLNQMGVLLP